MRFSPQFLDEIRTRVAVSDVVGRKVKLQKRGREYVGLSPFNPEKTPSFTVNDQKSFYHCFSSGKHGDIFSFVMETEGLSFAEAVERLAADAGLELPQADPRAAERAEKSRGLSDILEMAAAFFEEKLQAPEGAAARGYLADRGITDRARRQFRVGFAPAGRYDLKTWLAEKGVSSEDMVETGLVIAGDDIPVAYDRFRDRIIFPITDFRGRMVGFGGRAMNPDTPAKYLNSPETPVFHKGSLLYNGQTARQTAHDLGSVVVVEGYMDVIALAQAGHDNVVAPLGTALTEDQLALLWRMSDEPVLCFDGDKAGLKAAYRAIDLALPKLQPGKSLKFVLLPDGQDPDDLVSNQGAGAFDAALEGASPLVEVLWRRETSGRQLDTPEQRAALESALRDLVREISEPGVRRHYGEAIAKRLRQFWGHDPYPASDRRHNGSERAGYRDRKQFSGGTKLRGNALLKGTNPTFPPREAAILMALIHHPELIDSFMDDVAGLTLANQRLDSLRNSLLDIAAQPDLPDPAGCRAALEARGFDDLISELRRHVGFGQTGFALASATREDAEEGLQQAFFLHNRTLTLHKELMEAERALADEPSEESLERLRDIQAQLQNVEHFAALAEDVQDRF